MEILTVDIFQKMIKRASEEICNSESYLTEIDNVIGDGDHGIGMKRGFGAVLELLSGTSFANICDVGYFTGLELVKSMGGASGVIFGTMFIGGIDYLPRDNTANAIQIYEYFMQGERAIEKRGKSMPGQKTMLDALEPACTAMGKYLVNEKDIVKMFYKASVAAKQGAKDSGNLQSQKGRSKNFMEIAIGIPDPGAVSTSIIFKAFYDELCENVV